MALTLQDERVSVVPEVSHFHPSQVSVTPSVLPAVDGLAEVRAEGVAVAEVEVRHVAALDLVDSSTRAVLQVGLTTAATAGAHRHLVAVTLELSVPVRGSNPPIRGFN